MDASICETATRPVTAGSRESGFWNTATVSAEPPPLLPLPVTGPELLAVQPLTSASAAAVPAAANRAGRRARRRRSRELDMEHLLEPVTRPGSRPDRPVLLGRVSQSVG